MECDGCDVNPLCEGCGLLALARQALSSGADIPTICFDWAFRHLDRFQSQEILFIETPPEDLFLAMIQNMPDSAAAYAICPPAVSHGDAAGQPSVSQSGSGIKVPQKL